MNNTLKKWFVKTATASKHSGKNAGFFGKKKRLAHSTEKAKNQSQNSRQ